MVDTKGVFRTESNIYDGALLWTTFDWVLNTPLNITKNIFPGISKVKSMTF